MSESSAPDLHTGGRADLPARPDGRRAPEPSRAGTERRRWGTAGVVGATIILVVSVFDLVAMLVYCIRWGDWPFQWGWLFEHDFPTGIVVHFIVNDLAFATRLILVVPAAALAIASLIARRSILLRTVAAILLGAHLVGLLLFAHTLVDDRWGFAWDWIWQLWYISLPETVVMTILLILAIILVPSPKRRPAATPYAAYGVRAHYPIQPWTHEGAHEGAQQAAQQQPAAPPMPDPYYLRVGEQTYGPYSEPQMRAYAAEGRLVRSSRVRRGDSGEFTDAASHPELFD